MRREMEPVAHGGRDTITEPVGVGVTGRLDDEAKAGHRTRMIDTQPELSYFVKLPQHTLDGRWEYIVAA
jgi:hypothetical protein